MSLTNLALKRPVSAILIVLALFVFGISSILSFDLELTPEMEMPMLFVMTMYPGADPESVEELVTKVIEDAGSILSGVDSVQAQSSENVSMVMFSYDYGVDIDDCYMDLRTAMDTVSMSLPEDAKNPVIMEMNMNAQPVVQISVTAVGDIDLLKVVNDTVVPELESLAGAADISVSGGTEDYIKIELRQDMMQQYGLTMETVAQYLAAVDFNMPGGSVKQGTQDMSVSTSMEYNTVRALQTVPIVTGSGSVVQLADVANISESSRAAETVSRYDGNDNVSISIVKKQSVGTVNVAHDIEKVINRLAVENPALDMQIVYNASDAILSSLVTIGQTLALGVVLSMFVLFLFFGDFKASLIVGSSMPIALFATFILMNAMGFSLNVVTMGSLVIAIGMMVDSSIVVIESCFRCKTDERTFEEAARIGARAVTSSIIASTLTTIVVYFPLAIMKGLSGQMFSQLGFTIIFAMISSLISAMALVPLFYYKFRPVEKKTIPANRALEKLGRGYTKLISKVLYRKKTVAIFCVLLLVGSFYLVQHINVELMPASDEGVVSVSVQFRSGTNMETKDAFMQQLEEIVSAHEDVENCSMTIQSGSSASMSAYLRDDRIMSTAQVVEQFNEELKDMKNMDITVASGGNSMMSMSSSDASVSLHGDDIAALKIASRQVEEVMRSTPGVVKVSSSVADATTQAKVIVDPLKAMNVGLTPVQVATNINHILSGQKALTLTREGEEYEVWLEYPKGMFDSMNGLQNVVLTSPRGISVPLKDIAGISYTDEQETLMRADGKYEVSITGTTTEASRYTAPAAINQAVAELSFPEGVGLAETMMDEMMNEEFMALFQAIATAVFLVFLVMAMQFESPRFSMMIMMCIPFSLIGSFFLLFITQSTLSMVSLMGFLMLVGIVVNNGILYVDTTNQLRQEMPLEDALIKTGGLRLRPILMTTLTTILSMIPMGLGVGDNGELMQGMALVIIGGLVASTLLTLILIPTVYLIIDGLFRRKKKPVEEVV